MPVYKIEVTRSITARTTLYVRAETEELAEGRATAHAAEHIADSDLKVVDSEDDVRALRKLAPEEIVGEMNIIS